MKKNIYIILTIFICTICFTACSSKNEKQIQEVEKYLSEISEHEIKIDSSDNTNKNGMLTINIGYKNIHSKYREISEIYKDSDQQKLILSTIEKYISEDWFSGYFEYINNNDYFDVSEINEDILKIYE